MDAGVGAFVHENGDVRSPVGGVALQGKVRDHRRRGGRTWAIGCAAWEGGAGDACGAGRAVIVQLRVRRREVEGTYISAALTGADARADA